MYLQHHTIQDTKPSHLTTLRTNASSQDKEISTESLQSREKVSTALHLLITSVSSSLVLLINHFINWLLPRMINSAKAENQQVKIHDNTMFKKKQKTEHIACLQLLQ